MLKKFNELRTAKDVANFLDIDYKYLCFLLYGIKSETKYEQVFIPKRKGGMREISIPCSRIKVLQYKLLKELNDMYVPRKCVYGFVPERNAILNAERHVNKQVILNIDLKDYFSQIHFGRIVGLLKCSTFGLGDEAAKTIAQIVCYKSKLPQGACTSPVLANLVTYRLDNELMKLASENHITYTRYADDITFSTTKKSFPREITEYEDGKVKIGSKLKSILDDQDFKVNLDKVHYRTKKERQEVTGLTVNEKINVRRSYLNELRQMLFSCEKNGLFESAKKYLEVHKFEKQDMYQLSIAKITDEAQAEKVKGKIESWYKTVLRGKIDFLKQVRGKNNGYYIKYAKKYNELFEEEQFDIEETLSFYDECNNNCFILYNEDETCQGSCFYIKELGIVTNNHVVEDKDDFYKVVNNQSEVLRRIVGDDQWLKQNPNIDYSILKFSDSDRGWNICKKPSYEIGQKVCIVSFPNYSTGNSITIEDTKIIGKTTNCGTPIVTVGARILHGASGGAVLNEEHEVIGVVQAGVNAMEEQKYEKPYGFIKITDILDDLEAASS